MTMETWRSHPLRPTPGGGEKLFELAASVVTFHWHLFWVFIVAGFMAYYCPSLLQVAERAMAGTNLVFPGLSTAQVRYIAWIVGALLAVVWRYHYLSQRVDRPGRPALEMEPEAAAPPGFLPVKAVPPGQNPGTGRRASRPSKRPFPETMRRASNAAAIGLIVGALFGAYLAITIAGMGWSYALSPFAPAEWGIIALSPPWELTDHYVPIVLAAIGAMGLLAAAVLFAIEVAGARGSWSMD